MIYTTKVDKDGFIDLSGLPIDFNKAVSYKCFPKEDNTIHIRFYDKNGKWIKDLFNDGSQYEIEAKIKKSKKA